MSEYQIVEIFRTPTATKDFEFIVLLYKTELIKKKVVTSANDKLLKGHVFKNDSIQITNETEEGIDFNVIESGLSLFMGNVNTDELIYGQTKLLPFLNDTLPYYNAPLEVNNTERLNATTFSHNNVLFYNALGNLNSPIIGKVIYKTRVNLTVTNTLKFYFFFILEVSNNLLKVVVWRENIKFSSLKVGDVVGLQKYRINKGYSGLPCLDHNRFTEAAYFNVKEVTGTDIIKFNTKLETHGSLSSTTPFENIEGFIEYKSVLHRRCHNGIDEFYLVVVDNKRIVLFYNSDDVFYEIEAGNSIKITNLRRIERAGVVLFISTIYSQFEYDKITELDEACSSFLHESKPPTKRALESDLSLTNSSTANILGSCKTPEGTNDTSFLEKRTRQKRIKKSEDGNLEVTPLELQALFDGKRIAEVIEKEIEIKQPTTFVEIAFGFIPDSFNTLDDIFIEESEILHDKKYTVPMFYRPLKTSIKELKMGASNLVINEATKWLINAEVCGIDFSNYNDWEEQTLNDGCAISYIQDGSIKEQLPGFISIKDEEQLTCYVFPNYFTGETTLQDLYKFINNSSSYEDVLANVGKRFHFVVQAFRASDKNVLFVITGIFSEC